MLVSGARDIGRAMSCSSVSTLVSYLPLTRAPVLGCAEIKISSFFHCGQQSRRCKAVVHHTGPMRIGNSMSSERCITFSEV